MKCNMTSVNEEGLNNGDCKQCPEWFVLGTVREGQQCDALRAVSSQIWPAFLMAALWLTVWMCLYAKSNDGEQSKC